MTLDALTMSFIALIKIGLGNSCRLNIYLVMMIIWNIGWALVVKMLILGIPSRALVLQYHENNLREILCVRKFWNEPCLVWRLRQRNNLLLNLIFMPFINLPNRLSRHLQTTQISVAAANFWLSTSCLSAMSWTYSLLFHITWIKRACKINVFLLKWTRYSHCSKTMPDRLLKDNDIIEIEPAIVGG